MKPLSLKEIEKTYKIDFERIIKKIQKEKAKLVLLQFAEGLKPYATTIVDYLREETENKVEFLIWLESCYGACDTPVISKELEKEIDLILQFGHNDLMPVY